jgi:hypothetical protein
VRCEGGVVEDPEAGVSDDPVRHEGVPQLHQERDPLIAPRAPVPTQSSRASPGDPDVTTVAMVTRHIMHAKKPHVTTIAAKKRPVPASNPRSLPVSS